MQEMLANMQKQMDKQKQMVWFGQSADGVNQRGKFVGST